jgi:FAS-associated factor 2
MSESCVKSAGTCRWVASWTALMLQVAVEQIFSLGSAEDEMEPAPVGARASASGKGIAQMEVDDSTHRPRASSGSGLGGRARTGSVGLGLWRTVAWPVNFVLGVLWGGWYYLSSLGAHQRRADRGAVRTFLPLSFLPYLPRTLLPPSHSTSSTHATQSSVPQDPESCAKRFIESLERPTGGEHPTFYQGGYKDCLALARTEGKVVCVVLCCAEHEDDEAFKTLVILCADMLMLTRAATFWRTKS